MFFKTDDEKHENQSDTIESSKINLELAVSDLKDVCCQLIDMLSVANATTTESADEPVTDDESNIVKITRLFRTAVGRL